MALTTLSVLKTHLGITTTTEDARLTQFLNQASRFIQTYLQRELTQATYTEYLSGTNTPELLLRETPVTSITSVHLDGAARWGQGTPAFDSSTLLTAGDQYALRIDRPDGKSWSGILYRINGVWSGSMQRSNGLLSIGIVPGLGNIKVVYVGGFATIPDDIQWCACQMVSLMRQFAAKGSLVNSESFESRSISLAVPAQAVITPEIKAMLQPYRKLRA